MKRYQRGWFKYPDLSFLKWLFGLALIGALALMAAGGYALWWLIEHVRFA